MIINNGKWQKIVLHLKEPNLISDLFNGLCTIDFDSLLWNIKAAIFLLRELGLSLIFLCKETISYYLDYLDWGLIEDPREVIRRPLFT